MTAIRVSVAAVAFVVLRAQKVRSWGFGKTGALAVCRWARKPYLYKDWFQTMPPVSKPSAEFEASYERLRGETGTSGLCDLMTEIAYVICYQGEPGRDLWYTVSTDGKGAIDQIRREKAKIPKLSDKEAETHAEEILEKNKVLTPLWNFANRIADCYDGTLAPEVQKPKKLPDAPKSKAGDEEASKPKSKTESTIEAISQLWPKVSSEKRPVQDQDGSSKNEPKEDSSAEEEKHTDESTDSAETKSSRLESGEGNDEGESVLEENDAGDEVDGKPEAVEPRKPTEQESARPPKSSESSQQKDETTSSERASLREPEETKESVLRPEEARKRRRPRAAHLVATPPIYRDTLKCPANGDDPVTWRSLERIYPRRPSQRREKPKNEYLEYMQARARRLASPSTRFRLAK